MHDKICQNVDEINTLYQTSMSKIFGKHFPMFGISQKFAKICQNVDEINTLYQISMSKIFGKHFPMFSISNIC